MLGPILNSIHNFIGCALVAARPEGSTRLQTTREDSYNIEVAMTQNAFFVETYKDVFPKVERAVFIRHLFAPLQSAKFVLSHGPLLPRMFFFAHFSV